jgi:hypothetical protein
MGLSFHCRVCVRPFCCGAGLSGGPGALILSCIGPLANFQSNKLSTKRAIQIAHACALI